MNVLDWCLVALVGLRPVRLLAGLRHRRVRHRRAAARRPARRVAGARRPRGRRAVAVGVAGGALHRDPLRLRGPGGVPVRRRADPGAHPLAADPRGRRRRRGRPQRGGRAARRVGARGRRLGLADRRHHADGARVGGAGRGRLGAAGEATGVLQAFNNVVGRRSSRATSSPSRPSGSSRSRPGRRACSPTPTWSTRRAACSRCGAPTRCGSGLEGTGLPLLRGQADDQRPRRRRRAPARGGARRRHERRRDGRLLRPRIDVAVLALDDGDLPHLAFDRDAAPEDGVAIVGYPAGRALRRRRPAGSAPSSGCARPTSTATAPSSARCSRCAAWSGPATPGGRSCRRAATSSGLVFAASVTRPRHRLRADGRPGGRVGGRGGISAEDGRQRHLAPDEAPGSALALEGLRISLGLLDRALRGLDLLDLLEPMKPSRPAISDVDAEDDQEAPGRSSPVMCMK